MAILPEASPGTPKRQSGVSVMRLPHPVVAQACPLGVALALTTIAPVYPKRAGERDPGEAPDPEWRRVASWQEGAHRRRRPPEAHSLRGRHGGQRARLPSVARTAARLRSHGLGPLGVPRQGRRDPHASRVRAKVEHPFLVLKIIFGFRGRLQSTDGRRKLTRFGIGRSVFVSPPRGGRE